MCSPGVECAAVLTFASCLPLELSCFLLGREFSSFSGVVREAFRRLSTPRFSVDLQILEAAGVSCARPSSCSLCHRHGHPWFDCCPVPVSPVQYVSFSSVSVPSFGLVSICSPVPLASVMLCPGSRPLRALCVPSLPYVCDFEPMQFVSESGCAQLVPAATVELPCVDERRYFSRGPGFPVRVDTHRLRWGRCWRVSHTLCSGDLSMSEVIRTIANWTLLE